MTIQETRLSIAVNTINMEGLKTLNEVSDGLEHHYEMVGELRREITTTRLPLHITITREAHTLELTGDESHE